MPLAGLLEGEVGEGVICRGEGGQGLGQGQGQGIDNTIYVHQDLDSLEPADREVFPVARYYGDILKADNRWTAMVATRGCSLDCGYCSAFGLSLGQHRLRSVDSVVQEMARLERDHQLAGVYLEDDNLLLDRGWTVELLSALAARRGRLRVELPNGVDPMLLDDELLGLLGAAGVSAISLGIESTIEGNQQFLRRRLDRGHLGRVLGRARILGIRTTGFFIIGLPHDTTPALLRMFAEIKGMDLDLAHASLLRPPGVTIHGSSARLRALKAAFYLYFYADPARVAALARQGAGPGKMGRRYIHWLLG